MAYFLKVVGSGKEPCPEPYDFDFVDFSPRSRPDRTINIGDSMILYAAGGRKKIFAEATVVSDTCQSGNPEWPYRIHIDYSVNMMPGDGIDLSDISVNRNLSNSIGQQSYIRLTEEEFFLASKSLSEKSSQERPRRSFTVYWLNETWDEVSEETGPGEPLGYAGSEIFRRNGVSPGDSIYVVTIKKGKLLVAAKMVVGAILNRKEAAAVCGAENIWDSSEHIIASQSTPAFWDRRIADDVTERLRFVTPDDGEKPLKFRKRGELDGQTLRTIRRLTEDSARELDALLGNLRKIGETLPFVVNKTSVALGEFESYPEGKREQKFVTVYERDPKNRAAALKIHGFTCKACDLNFEEFYGPHGKDFIHVHHIKPISEFAKPTAVDPAVDLTVLCPNCHAMVHKNKKKTLTVDELRLIIRENGMRSC